MPVNNAKKFLNAALSDESLWHSHRKRQSINPGAYEKDFTAADFKQVIEELLKDIVSGRNVFPGNAN